MAPAPPLYDLALPVGWREDAAAAAAAGRRERHADGLILVFTLADGLDDEERRLRDAGVEITMPLREEPWGERLFQVTDPSGVIVRFVEWVTRGTQEQAG
ncbi:VOC family protein [Streptomyces pharetrae]|uniref:VOC family protein n=1 Tax=Streptomyces pharetrae TaxID=291370 RepID=UPI003F4D9E3C